MKSLLSKIILGSVLLTALAAVSAFGCAFASMGMAGGDLSRLSGELFAFSRVGLLAVVLLVAIYAVAFVDWSLETNAETPAATPTLPGNQTAPTSPAQANRLVPPSRTIEHDD